MDPRCWWRAQMLLCNRKLFLQHTVHLYYQQKGLRLRSMHNNNNFTFLNHIEYLLGPLFNILQIQFRKVLNDTFHFLLHFIDYLPLFSSPSPSSARTASICLVVVHCLSCHQPSCSLTSLYPGQCTLVNACSSPRLHSAFKRYCLIGFSRMNRLGQERENFSLGELATASRPSRRSLPTKTLFPANRTRIQIRDFSLDFVWTSSV